MFSAFFIAIVKQILGILKFMLLCFRYANDSFW